MTTPAVVVHTTPPLGQLPASDAESIRLLSTLRASGIQAGVQTAQWTSNGKPFVTLNNLALPTTHLSSLPGWNDPNAELSTKDRADALSWETFLEGQVLDLINHTLYSLPPNYPVIHAAQVKACPFPMNHYVPQRIRSITKSRLEAVGLWGLGGQLDTDAQAEDRKRLEDEFIIGAGGTKVRREWSGWNAGKEQAARMRKFGEESLAKKARAAFDPIARKLGENRYFYGTSITSLDIALFSLLSLVLDVELPNALIADLLRSTYPSIVKHHERVLKKLFPTGWAGITRLADPVTESASASLVDDVKSYLPSWLGGPSTSKPKPKPEAGVSPEEDARAKAMERKFRYGRWAWFAGAGIALVTYLLASGIVDISFNGDDEEWDEDEEDDEEFEEDEWAVVGPGGLEIVEDDIVEDETVGGAVIDLAPEMNAPTYGSGSGLPVYDDDDEAEAERAAAQAARAAERAEDAEEVVLEVETE